MRTFSVLSIAAIVCLIIFPASFMLGKVLVFGIEGLGIATPFAVLFAYVLIFIIIACRICRLKASNALLRRNP